MIDTPFKYSKWMKGIYYGYCHRVIQDNLVWSTELRSSIGYCGEFLQLTFRALTPRYSDLKTTCNLEKGCKRLLDYTTCTNLMTSRNNLDVLWNGSRLFYFFFRKFSSFGFIICGHSLRREENLNRSLLSVIFPFVCLLSHEKCR